VFAIFNLDLQLAAVSLKCLDMSIVSRQALSMFYAFLKILAIYFGPYRLSIHFFSLPSFVHFASDYCGSRYSTDASDYSTKLTFITIHRYAQSVIMFLCLEAESCNQVDA
jgi:hypothetical protein